MIALAFISGIGVGLIVAQHGRLRGARASIRSRATMLALADSSRRAWLEVRALQEELDRWKALVDSIERQSHG